MQGLGGIWAGQIPGICAPNPPLSGARSRPQLELRVLLRAREQSGQILPGPKIKIHNQSPIDKLILFFA